MADLNREILEQRGYTQYKPTPFDSDGVNCRFQKRFDDAKGKKYFIDAVEWASWRHPHTGDVFPVSYEFETQMYRKDSHSAFDISFHSSWSLDQVEAFVEALFASGVCDYYELFYSEEE